MHAGASASAPFNTRDTRWSVGEPHGLTRPGSFCRRPRREGGRLRLGDGALAEVRPPPAVASTVGVRQRALEDLQIFQALRLPEQLWMTGTLVYSETFWRYDAVGLRDMSL
jgi:hypothetical protein